MANIRTPFKAYSKHVASRPLLDSAAHGAVGAGLGYAGGTLASRVLLGMPFQDKSEEEISKMTPEQHLAYLRKKKILADNKASGKQRKAQIIGSLLGGAAGAALPLGQSLNTGISLEQNMSKALNKEEFYKDNPDVLDQERQDARNSTKRKTRFRPGATPFDSGRSRLYKKGSWDSYTSNHIPVHVAMGVIERDPFLTLGQKKTINGFIGNTYEGDSGSISGQTIANTAVKAGIGGLAGFAFGKTLGNIFALESEQVNRLSRYGGVAGAIYNTGILKETLGDIL